MMEFICRRELCTRLRMTGLRRVQQSRAFTASYAQAAKSNKYNSKKKAKVSSPDPKVGNKSQIGKHNDYKPKPKPSFVAPISTPKQKPVPDNVPPSSIQPPPPKPKSRKPPGKVEFAIIGVFVLTFSSYLTYTGVHLYKASQKYDPLNPPAQFDVSCRYDAIARKFDSEVDYAEWMMGMPKKRQMLCEQAHGDVLEVSFGTGRNLEYYDWDFPREGKPAGYKGRVRSFTAVDKSEEMLEVGHEKFSALYPGILGVRWIVGDAAKEIPAPPRNANERSGNLVGKKYDTIVQTFGICSVADPVALLKNLGECVKEEEGRILLLEHGKGSWEWLNYLLDISAEGHARGFGCWWNRDLKKIVEESGLEVVKMETWKMDLGTNWWIELKKPKSTSNVEAVAEAVEAVETKIKSKGWWYA